MEVCQIHNEQEVVIPKILSTPVQPDPDGLVFGQKLYFPVLLGISHTGQVCVELPAVQLSLEPAQFLCDKNETLIHVGVFW